MTTTRVNQRANVCHAVCIAIFEMGRSAFGSTTAGSTRNDRLPSGILYVAGVCNFENELRYKSNFNAYFKIMLQMQEIHGLITGFNGKKNTRTKEFSVPKFRNISRFSRISRVMLEAEAEMNLSTEEMGRKVRRRRLPVWRLNHG